MSENSESNNENKNHSLKYEELSDEEAEALFLKEHSLSKEEWERIKASSERDLRLWDEFRDKQRNEPLNAIENTKNIINNLLNVSLQYPLAIASLLLSFSGLGFLVYFHFTKDNVERDLPNYDFKSVDSRIIHNLPEEMTVRSSEKVTVRITRRTAEDLLSNLEGNGNPEIKTIRSVHNAKVTLKGDSEFFDISLKNGEEEKVVSSEGTTDWFFEVIPKQAGEANLYLNVNVLYVASDGNRSVKEYPEVRKVKINNSTLSSVILYIQNNFLTILGLFIAFLAVGFIGTAVQKRISRWKSQIGNFFKSKKPNQKGKKGKK